MNKQFNIEKFRKQNDISQKDNCFYEDAKQVALGLRLSFNDKRNRRKYRIHTSGFWQHGWQAEINAARWIDFNRSYNLIG